MMIMQNSLKQFYQLLKQLYSSIVRELVRAQETCIAEERRQVEQRKRELQIQEEREAQLMAQMTGLRPRNHRPRHRSLKSVSSVIEQTTKDEDGANVDKEAETSNGDNEKIMKDTGTSIQHKRYKDCGSIEQKGQKPYETYF